MTVNDDNARAAELLADIDPELAARFRARAKIGVPKDEALRARLTRIRNWMIEQLKTRKLEEVLAEAARKHGGTREYWWNVLKGKGRPPDYFGSETFLPA